jgi:hypothetical protein
MGWAERGNFAASGHGHKSLGAELMRPWCPPLLIPAELCCFVLVHADMLPWQTQPWEGIILKGVIGTKI